MQVRVKDVPSLYGPRVEEEAPRGPDGDTSLGPVRGTDPVMTGLSGGTVGRGQYVSKYCHLH